MLLQWPGAPKIVFWYLLTLALDNSIALQLVFAVGSDCYCKHSLDFPKVNMKQRVGRVLLITLPYLDLVHRVSWWEDDRHQSCKQCVLHPLGTIHMNSWLTDLYVDVSRSCREWALLKCLHVWQVDQMVHCASLLVQHCQHMLTRIDRLSMMSLQAPPSSYIGNTLWINSSLTGWVLWMWFSMSNESVIV